MPIAIGTKPNLEYLYDAMGNRITKIVKPAGSTSLDWVYTHYVRDAQGNVMATYKKENINQTTSYQLTERHIYGSSRVGIDNKAIELIGYTAPSDDLYRHQIGLKNYELTNHLGNLNAVITDRKIPRSTNGLNIDYYMPDIVSATDYYPFGAPMPGRNFGGEKYRFGFNGQERDDEVAGNGNINTAMFWEYDTRLGRRWNLDTKPNHSISYYAAFANNPNLMNDPNGDTTYIYNTKGIYQGVILDKLKTNEVVFMTDAYCNAVLNLNNSHKYTAETMGTVARKPELNVARITPNTTKQMSAVRQKYGSSNPERMGLLWIDGKTHELNVWECKDCGESSFQSDESKMFNSDFSFEGENSVKGIVFAKWHTHLGTTYDATKPTNPNFSTDFSSTYIDAYIPQKLGANGVIGTIISDNTFTLYNMAKNGSTESDYKRFSIKQIGERKLK